MHGMQRISIRRPDDFHLHLRDGAELRSVIADSAARFGRAVVMPNLKSPVVTTTLARRYRKRILDAVPAGVDFEPLMTLYLTDATPPREIVRARDSGVIHAVKLYPAGATTNSQRGVTEISRVYAVLETMQRLGMPLLVHGELTDPDIDVFDREAAFIERVLVPLLGDFPELRVVFEHATTAEAVAFVEEGPPHIAATLTVHHLLLNRNALFAGGLRPHHYCLPVLKRERHREALVRAATSGNPKFFLGTDSAPHSIRAKLDPCGCAGIYTAHAALELYAEIFDAVGRLDRLEGFASRFGAQFYGLPLHSATTMLKKEPWRLPETLAFGRSSVVPLHAGQWCQWRICTD